MNALILVMAIWIAEGGDATRYPYGVIGRYKEPRRICLNTVCNQWERWDGRGCFIDSLADRYCPPATDLVGNRNWKKNVKALVGHDRCDCQKAEPTLDRPAWFPPTNEYRKRLTAYRRQIKRKL